MKVSTTTIVDLFFPSFYFQFYFHFCIFPLIHKKYKMNNWKEKKNLISHFFIILYFQCSSSRWEPQISVLCEAGQQYLPQYLSEDGRWTSELSVKVPGVSCLRDKMDLLDYCKKVSTYLFSTLDVCQRASLYCFI